MTQTLKRAQQRAGIRTGRQMRGAFALGFQTDRVDVGQRGAEPALDTMKRVVVEPACQPCEQFGEGGGQQLENLRRIDTDLADRPGRQHQERNHEPGERADRDLEQPVDG